MRFRQVEVFHAVYVTGSVSGGARALNVSQPTVSKVLRHLEDQLGFNLFDRQSGRLFPTKKGIELFTEIEPLFERMNELTRFTARLAKTKAGSLRFAMTPAFGLELAPKALAQFSKANPDVTIEVETLHAAQLVKALMASEIDIGLVFDAPGFAGIEATHIGQTKFICVAPESFKFPHGASYELKDLEGHSLITLNEKSALGKLLARKLETAFQDPIDSRIVVETYHIAKRLVKEEAGIAIVDGLTAFSGSVAGLSFHNITPSIPINVDVITRVNEPTERYVEAFVADLRLVLAQFLETTPV